MATFPQSASPIAATQAPHSPRATPGSNGHAHAVRAGVAPRCTACGTVNAAERRFCASCGVSLWAPCLACGEWCAAGERFCGACGSNLAESLQARASFLENQELYARSMQVAHRYGEALAALEPLRGATHPRLAEHAARIEALLAELRGETVEWERRHARDSEAARAAFVRCDYDEAVRLLSELPEHVCSEPTRELWREASARRREAAALHAEIRAAVSARSFGGLLAKVERLLEIKPGDAQAQALIERLRSLEQTDRERRREALKDAASRRLSACQYDAAVELLEQIAPTARTAEIDKMLEFAREVAFLNGSLRTAIVLDDHLPALAERLRKLRPQDPFPARLLEQLRKAGAQPPGDLVAAIQARQTKTEASSVFEMPLAILRGARRLAIDPAVAASAAFTAHDANLGIAWGLALQGLGRAAIDVNLRPSETGFRKLLSGAVRKRSARSAWGLDLGQCSLKAVRLTLGPDEEPLCDAVECIEYPGGTAASDADGTAAQQDALRALIERRKDVAEAPLCLGVPGQDLFARFFKTPPLDRKKLDGLVQFEARNQIPFDLNLFVWDYHVFAQGDGAKEFGEFDVGVFAVRLAQLERRLALLEEVGLRPQFVQANGVALHNFVLYDRLAADAGGKAPAGLTVTLDLGSETTGFVVGGPEFLWLRSIPVGGGAMTKAIVRELKLTTTQAETMKRRPATAARWHRMHQALDPVLDELVTQVQHSLRCFANTYPDRAVRRMVLHGDGVKLLGLLRRLRTP